jgi:hypothetical protein
MALYALVENVQEAFGGFRYFTSSGWSVAGHVDVNGQFELRSQRRGRDSPSRVAGMESAVEKRGGVFSALGSMPAGFW